MGVLVLLLVIALVWMFRQILTAPLLASCEFCGAAPDEPCSVDFHIEREVA